MRIAPGSCSAWLAAALALPCAGPARADVTVVGHYTFVDGDTATRSSEFTSQRVRVPTPDGREVIFDSKAGRLTLIDHRRRVYWTGALARADSIVDVTDGSRWDFMLGHASDRLKAEWAQAMSYPADSIRVADGNRIRMIAGYPCDLWTVSAGPYTSIERWFAASLDAEPFYEPTGDVVLAAVLDPVARAIMTMFWDSQQSDGLCLGATMTFDAPTQHGRFHWEAGAVSWGRIPESTWRAPPGYRQVGLANEIPGAADLIARADDDAGMTGRATRPMRAPAPGADEVLELVHEALLGP